MIEASSGASHDVLPSRAVHSARFIWSSLSSRNSNAQSGGGAGPLHRQRPAVLAHRHSVKKVAFFFSSKLVTP